MPPHLVDAAKGWAVSDGPPPAALADYLAFCRVMESVSASAAVLLAVGLASLFTLRRVRAFVFSPDPTMDTTVVMFLAVAIVGVFLSCTALLAVNNAAEAWTSPRTYLLNLAEKAHARDGRTAPAKLSPVDAPSR